MEMNFALTPAQFSLLEEKLSVQQSGFKLTPSSALVGSLLTPDVTLSYVYDGTANLNVILIAKHSLKARLASDGAIQSKIQELFQQEIATA